MPTLDRITQRADVVGGKACIRGLRVTVGMVVGQIATGRSVADLLADYPYLEHEDILQALASNRAAIQVALQRLPGVPVDVLTPRALPDHFRSVVLAEAVPV
jgi:uncharacterized protein (DUF433 family)